MDLSLKQLALAVACALSAAGHAAEAIDVGQLLEEQLKKAGKLAPIYKELTGKALPADVDVTVKFKGKIQGAGVEFAMPPVLTEKPHLVSSARASNCSSSDILRVTELNSETTNTLELKNYQEVKTEEEVKIGFEAPFKVSAGGTINHTLQVQTTDVQTSNRKIAWKESLQVPVRAGKEVDVQFVVTEQVLQGADYAANLLVTGDVRIEFSKGPQEFAWKRVTGNQLPQGTLLPGGALPAGSIGAVCRAEDLRKRKWIGTTMAMLGGTRCAYGRDGVVNDLLATDINASKEFEVLVGPATSLKLGDPYAADALEVEKTKICFAQKHKAWLSGHVSGRNCVAYFPGEREIETRNYQVLRKPAGNLGKTERIENLLAEKERTFNLKGKVNGVNAVYGDFRIGVERAAGCSLIGTRAAGDAKPQAALMPVKLVKPDASAPTLLPASAIVKKAVPAKAK